ncbi:MAG: dihydropteroate synthase [Bacillota bacterium]
MGILNVNPDSFSDGGKYLASEAALARAKQMLYEGADIIDIGGESTRPGYEAVPKEIELERVIPVINRIRQELSSTVMISIDTQKAEVARLAMEAGANIINDIWGLQGDVEMAEVAAKTDAGIIIMHNSDTGEYSDIIDDMKMFFERSLETAEIAGISEARIALDPGIGFGKTFDNNIEVLSRLEELNSFGLPILLGTSRKRFIGEILNCSPEDRLEGTLASNILGIVAGADFLRVHDVKEMRRAANISDEILRR